MIKNLIVKNSKELIETILSSDYDYVVICCNCFCNQSEKVASIVHEFFKTAFLNDKKTVLGDVYKLATYHKIQVKKDVFKPFYLINLYCQYKAINSIEYTAFGLGLRNLSNEFSGNDKILILTPNSIYGLDENVLKTIIKIEISEFNVTVLSLKYGN